MRNCLLFTICHTPFELHVAIRHLRTPNPPVLKLEGHWDARPHRLDELRTVRLRALAAFSLAARLCLGRLLRLLRPPFALGGLGGARHWIRDRYRGKLCNLGEIALLVDTVRPL